MRPPGLWWTTKTTWIRLQTWVCPGETTIHRRNFCETQSSYSNCTYECHLLHTIVYYRSNHHWIFIDGLVFSEMYGALFLHKRFFHTRDRYKFIHQHIHMVVVLVSFQKKKNNTYNNHSDIFFLEIHTKLGENTRTQWERKMLGCHPFDTYIKTKNQMMNKMEFNQTRSFVEENTMELCPFGVSFEFRIFFSLQVGSNPIVPFVSLVVCQPSPCFKTYPYFFFGKHTSTPQPKNNQTHEYLVHGFQQLLLFVRYERTGHVKIHPSQQFCVSQWSQFRQFFVQPHGMI